MSLPRSLRALSVCGPRMSKISLTLSCPSYQDEDANSSTDHNGAYLEKSGLKALDDIYPWGLSEREARKMWEWSEKILGQKFRY